MVRLRKALKQMSPSKMDKYMCEEDRKSVSSVVSMTYSFPLCHGNKLKKCDGPRFISLSQHLFNAPTEACMLAATSTSSFENTCFFKVLLAR